MWLQHKKTKLKRYEFFCKSLKSTKDWMKCEQSSFSCSEDLILRRNSNNADLDTKHISNCSFPCVTVILPSLLQLPFYPDFILMKYFWSDISAYLYAVFQEHCSCKDEAQTSEISASSSPFCLPRPSPLSFYPSVAVALPSLLWGASSTLELIIFKIAHYLAEMKSRRTRIFFLRRRIFLPFQ